MRGQESFGQAITVSGLLAGFSFTAMVGLLAIQRASVSFNIAFYSFLIATFFFIAATLGSWGVLEWMTEKETAGYQETRFYTVTLVSFVLGLLAFVVGVVGVAFLHSVIAGLVSVAAGLAVIVFFFAIAAEVSSK